MTIPTPSLPWPTDAGALPAAKLRPVLERLAALARSHERDVTLIPGLAQEEDEEIAADPPPALEQVADEFGGIELRGHVGLTLLIDDRSDVGPYTMLGEHTTYYPLHEGADVAVILTVDEAGAPGAVYGIGEDLALRLAATDLSSYLTRYADALEATLDGLDTRIRELYGPESVNDEETRTEVAADLMDQHLFWYILGTEDEGDRPTAPLTAPDPARTADLPTGTIGVADLRGAELGTVVDVVEAEVDDPLAHHLVWRESGLLVCLVPDAD